MKITDLQIDGFGAWSDLKLDHFSDGLTVFYGPNEAGKTTLMQFMRSVLYGYSQDRRLRYLPPAAGGRSGGAIGAIGSSGRFNIRRTPTSSLNGDDLGKLEISSSNGARQGGHVLTSLLSGIDESIFTNVFAVGLRELQELSTLNDTEAAQQLYKLTSGMDRVSLVDVMRELESRRNGLLSPDDGPCELQRLIDRREQLQIQISELSSAGLRWMQLSANRHELQDEVRRLEESIQRMDKESRAVEVAVQVRENWLRRVEVAKELEELGPPVVLPERAVERIDALNKQIADYRALVEKLKRQRRTLADEAKAQYINRELLANAGRAAAVCEHEPWIASLEAQLKRLRLEIAEHETELRGRWEKLGLSAEELPNFTPEVSARTMATLRGPARAVREAADKVQDAKRERDDARRQADELQEKLKAELAETGEVELDKALEEAGSRVTKLRRRIALQDRLEKLDRERKEMEEDRRELLEEQILPVARLVWCGVPFIFGSMMVLAGVFWPNVAELGWRVITLGTIGVVVGVVMKLWMERTAHDELEACERSLDRVIKKVDEIKDERDALDEQLPRGGGPLDARLNDAEDYVKRLENLAPLDAQRRTAVAKADAAKEKSAAAGEAVKESRDRWRDALRSVGLPESFAPEHIQQLSDGNDQTLQLARRLESKREELKQREAEHAALTGRIEQVLSDIHLSAASDDPKIRLRQLSSALQEQQQWVERRKELRQQMRQAKKSYRQEARVLRGLVQQRRTLLSQAGANDEKQLRRLADRQQQIERLTAEHKQLVERIGLSIGNRCPEAAVAEVLTSHGDEKLENYWDRLLARLQDAQARLTQLHESRGEMVQEMKTLAEDRRLPQAKLELSCVHDQIREAIRRWHVIASAGIMLEEIRQIYETERQPETLAEASQYLARLTQNRYRRIWTPLSEQSLRIDTADGECLPLDVLSTGTREAVFISLRLALVAAYSRRGAALPLVLDDVLVNFDTARASAAAAVLRDFAAAGHQMLLFTCHQHILEIFENVGVEVRCLPSRNGAEVLPIEPAKPQIAAEAAEFDESEYMEPIFIEPSAGEVEPMAEVAAHDPSLIHEFGDDQVAVADEPEEVHVSEPVEVAAVAESEPESDEDTFDHSAWDDADFHLADEDDEAQTDLLAILARGGSGHRDLAERWWETDEAVA